MVTSDSWNEDHNRRHRGLVQAFDPEQIRKRTRQWKAEHRDQINATQRRKRMKAQRDTPPPPPRDAPPCGGDCENCPWDDGCHYEDWEAPPKWRRDYQQLRRKMEEDPEYADHKRTLANERNRRYRVHQKQRMADDSEYAERMRQSKKDKDRKYRAQQKQRMADNPEYAELMRQRKREQNRKYRAQKKEAKK